MSDVIRRILFFAAAATALVSCASAPPDETQEERQRTVEAILTEPSDDRAYGEKQRCLTSAQYRNFKVLDEEHIVFEGSRGRYWLNSLRTRCPDLRRADVLRMRSTFSLGRICAMDSFSASEWFEWPWYRRWPWAWGSRWDPDIRCYLGEFQPVTAAQVAALEAALKR